MSFIKIIFILSAIKFYIIYFVSFLICIILNFSDLTWYHRKLVCCVYVRSKEKQFVRYHGLYMNTTLLMSIIMYLLLTLLRKSLIQWMKLLLRRRQAKQMQQTEQTNYHWLKRENLSMYIKVNFCIGILIIFFVFILKVYIMMCF